jgi:hypothetical protein
MSGIFVTILFDLLTVVLVLALLAAVTSLGVAKLEAAHPPTGQFIDVQGVRLHVAVLGLARDAGQSLPSC